MSIYVVHTTKDGARSKYTTFQRAFRAFKDATKDRWTDVALWHGQESSHDNTNVVSWKRVYCTEHYPVGLSRPWEKPRPHSFFQSEE